MSQAHLFALGVLLAWLAGIRVYLTVFGVGLAGCLGWLQLPEALQVAQSPWVLGVSGALLQAIVRNPLADPGLLGVTAGAGVAALLAIVWLPQATLLVPVIAFLGGAAAFLALLGAGFSGTRPGGPLRIVLSGTALQALLMGVVALILFFYADRAPAFMSSFTIRRHSFLPVSLRYFGGAGFFSSGGGAIVGPVSRSRRNVPSRIFLSRDFGAGPRIPT